MKSPIVKRSVVLAGHKTSVSLEDAFWRGLKDIAATRRVRLSDLVGSIDTEPNTATFHRRYGSSCSATTKRARHCLIQASRQPTNTMQRTDSANGR